MILRITNKLKRTFNDYKEKKYLTSFIDSGKSIYNFSKNDLELYIKEKKTLMPPLEVIQSNKDIVNLSIFNTKFSWPKSVSQDDLPWLYHEIFDEFECNPSSYNHPNMQYESAAWIIDAGCCEGFFSLFADEKNVDALLIALEPLKEMDQSLCDTFEKKISEKTFILDKSALGKDVGRMSFNFDGEHLCDSSFSGNNNSKGKSYEVEVVNLDTLMEKYKLKESGVIKMDIEGAEMDALLGGQDILKKYKPKLAIAVYHEYENAMKCKDIILKANPDYKIEFRGMYGYFTPPRPYILFAW